MARSIGGSSYSISFFVFVSESICSLLNRLAERHRFNSGQNASAPEWGTAQPGLQRGHAMQVRKIYDQNKK
jgi:hypothetical protein